MSRMDRSPGPLATPVPPFFEAHLRLRLGQLGELVLELHDLLERTQRGSRGKEVETPFETLFCFE